MPTCLLLGGHCPAVCLAGAMFQTSLLRRWLERGCVKGLSYFAAMLSATALRTTVRSQRVVSPQGGQRVEAPRSALLFQDPQSVRTRESCQLRLGYYPTDTRSPPGQHAAPQCAGREAASPYVSLSAFVREPAHRAASAFAAALGVAQSLPLASRLCAAASRQASWHRCPHQQRAVQRVPHAWLRQLAPLPLLLAPSTASPEI
mmetsp:Transcript_46130/g.107283  ORF Transcript_46130/g.107283 Transcript_46130/m.107283 type:complete len:203 (+) Transcript_46130:454-1062(+)